ncbi:hypothetical protein AUCHE_22_00360 [Austwickia chelonae NBRC 105200]|uniref:CAAX prenyl protease 2/Lysostaphin resistance protein A-like domain-containing protein n=1 Tax=Austwickia chelonae NBRC 105200 TaxID=1184607 RepID=K6UNU7_9MICO|nr:hypothetical protein AUCHE_22_00360 [Austwickia chelonae NBRC 105200]
MREVRDFLVAALYEPVPRTREEDKGSRRRVVTALTLVVAVALVAYSLRIPAGDPRFYPATLALAGTYVVGALASGPLRLGRAHRRRTGTSRPVVQPLLLGVLLLGVFIGGAGVVAQLPLLRDPVEELLDHARSGSLPLVLAITVVNGIAEELFYRGALYPAVGGRSALAVTTVVYTVVTAAAGIPLLAFAAAALGLVVGLQRRVTGGVLGPIITHLTWSVGMLFLLPPALSLFGDVL